MTVEQLVAEARVNRLPGVPFDGSKAKLASALRSSLNIVLDSSNYEADVKSAPAVVARILATLIANVEGSESLHQHPEPPDRTHQSYQTTYQAAEGCKNADDSK